MEYENVSLHELVETGNVTQLKTFLTQDSNVTLLNNYKESALFLSLCLHPHSGIPELLIEHGALFKENSEELNQDELHRMLCGAIQGLSIHYVKLALYYKANPNQQGLFHKWGEELPLNIALFQLINKKAATQNIVPIITLLIQHGANTQVIKEPKFIKESAQKAYEQDIKPLYSYSKSYYNKVYTLRALQITGKRKAPRLQTFAKKRYLTFVEEAETYAYMQQLFESAN